MPFILVAVLIDMIAIGVMVPVLPHLVGGFTTSNDEQALAFLAVTVAFGVANFLSAPVLGALSDRWGRRPVLLLGFMGLALSFFVTALATALWMLLAGFFLRRYAQENGKRILGFSEEAMQRLMAWSWPGNVRELEHAVERAVVLCRGERIEVEQLPGPMTVGSARSKEAEGRPVIPGSSIAELERYAILETLRAVGGSTSKAAKLLGVSARKIQYKLHEYGRAGDGEAGA